jgi:hypothetical protein
MLKDEKKVWEVRWASGQGVTCFEKKGDAYYFENSVKDTNNAWVSTKLVGPLLGVKVHAEKMRIKAQQREPTYHGTSYDVPGAPLPAFLEPYIFPRYNTDEVRELSLLQLAPDIAETVVFNAGMGVPWQDAFEKVLVDMDANEFSEVRRRVFQLLPENAQIDLIW